MWEFFGEILRQFGFHGLAELALSAALIYVVRAYQRKDRDTDALRERLVLLSESRRNDARECEKQHRELAESVKAQIQLLVEVLKGRCD